MTIAALLEEATVRFSVVGIENPELDAQVLLQHLLGYNRAQLFLHAADTVPAPLLASCQRGIEARAARIPLAYVLEEQEFWSLPFYVSPAVLIPRQETEFVVEQTLHQCKTLPPHPLALDLCTGSGIIAVVLARELNASVVAVDCSVAALQVAAYNIRRHGVQNSVRLLCADLLNACLPKPYFNLIVANPPYVADGEIASLQPELRRFEPRLALAGGADGMAIIRRIAAVAGDFLLPGGLLALEIGADQEYGVLEIFRTAPHPYVELCVLPDWAGKARFFQARMVQSTGHNFLPTSSRNP